MSSRVKTYDLVVIGSGPAGIHAAVQAAKLKKKVCIIEKVPGHIGGCWVHWGTLPSKTLRESLDAVHSISSHVGEEWVDRVVEVMKTGKIFDRALRVSQEEEALIRKHIQNNNIELIEGFGSIEGRNSVRVLPAAAEPFLLQAEYILIGTGSQPRRPSNIPFDGWRVIDSDDVMNLKHIPKSLIIYGAGVVGCEYACIFQALGVNVTVADSRSRILQYLDNEIGDELQRSMESLGVKFCLSVQLDKIDTSGPKVIATCSHQKIEGDVLLFTAGRVSCTERIGLEKVGIQKNDKGAIVVNENFQTIIPNIYAAGDAIGPPALASTSSQQGRHVACHAFGVLTSAFPTVFPIGVYTIPELSMVGKTEEELKTEGVDYVVGRATYSEIARGYIRGDNHGLLKLLVSRQTHKLLGIHVVGADACNLIHIGLVFMLKGGHVQDMVNMIFNYPTLAEGYRIAAFNALNKIFKDGMIKSPHLDETSLKALDGKSSGILPVKKALAKTS